jgi:NTE family protein
VTERRRRALILGGGGITGIAWETGVLIGLRDAGVDITDWELVVGTSAGSVVASHLLGDPDFDRFWTEQAAPWRAAEDTPIRTAGGRLAWATLRLSRRRGLTWLPRAWIGARAMETLVRQRAGRGRGVTRPHPAPLAGIRPIRRPDWMASRVGAFAFAARTASEAVYLPIVESILRPVTDWPNGLVVTAVDAVDGTAVAIDDRSGVPLIRAVAASCAVPTLMPPVTIGGRPYVDGGVGSQTHAILADGYDDALIVAPIDLGTLAAEVDELRGTGCSVGVVQPGADALRVIGRHLEVLDAGRRARSAEFGRRDGQEFGAALIESGWGAVSPESTKAAG